MTSNEFQVLKGKDCVLSLSHGLKHCVNIGLDEGCRVALVAVKMRAQQ